MRGREFTMKDAYSFDRDEAGAQRSYDIMYAAYQRIFQRLAWSSAPWRPTPARSADRAAMSSRSSPTPART